MYLLLALDFWGDFSVSSYANIYREIGQVGAGPSALLVAKHILQRVRWRRPVHRIVSFHFRMKRTIKMVISSFTFTVTFLYFFLLLDFSLWEVFKPWEVTWKRNRKVLSSVGMKGSWSTGEIKICFPSIPNVTEGIFSWATSASQIWNLFPNWVRFREKNK